MNDTNMHPTGLHSAVVIDHGITKSTNGTCQVAVKFETEYGLISGWFPMTDKAAEYTIEKLNNMGFNGRSLEGLQDGKCICGNKCVITVAHEEYNGKTSAKVKYVNPEGYEGMEIKRDAEAQQNIKRFDALLHKSQGGMNRPNPTAAATPAVDDMPF